MEGRVSNLTFDPTNKRHVSFRIAFQRGPPGAEWASFVIHRVWDWLTGAGVGGQGQHKTKRKTVPQLCHEKEDKQMTLITDYLYPCTAVVKENACKLLNLNNSKFETRVKTLFLVMINNFFSFFPTFFLLNQIQSIPNFTLRFRYVGRHFLPTLKT